MSNIFSVAIVLVFIFVAFTSLIYFSSAFDDTMTVEANIIASGGDGEIIRVEVPDYLFFGNVSVGDKSDELKVYINNTGNVDISVTPTLLDDGDEFFSNLQFRKFKTSNGTAVSFSRIGDFKFDISKPASGESFNDAYFYVMLDLTDFDGEINENILGHRTDVKFIAVAK